MKKLFYLIAFLGITLSAKAQYSAVPDTARISIGVDGDYPTAAFSNAYSGGVGASAQVDVPITEKLYATANGGFDVFFPNNANITTNPEAIVGYSLPSMHLVPVKIGLKYFLIRTFYIQAEAGETFLLNKSVIGINALNSTGFTYAAQMGILFKLKKKSYLDVGFKLQRVQSFYGDGSYNNFLGLRIAYAFNL
jgi:hypothetical protein